MANSIYEALLEIQSKGIEGVTFDSTNPHFKNRYISLGKLMDTVLPVLNEAGILVTQIPATFDYGPSLTTTLTHVESDTSISGNCPLTLDRESAQAVGSAITYMRRYALLSMLGLVADEDDDGEAASEASTREPGWGLPEGVEVYKDDPEKIGWLERRPRF